jgi:hypothetical protein
MPAASLKVMTLKEWLNGREIEKRNKEGGDKERFELPLECLFMDMMQISL